MKHIRILGALLAGAMAVCFCLSGCGGEKEPQRPEEHVHDWGEWQITAPTCEEKGEKKRVCKTDSSHVEREEIPALGHKWSKEWTAEASGHFRECENGCGERSEEGEHSFQNGKCEVCGYALTPSALRYEEVLGEDGKTVMGYSVSGWAENATDRTQLVIPAEHEGKPVIAIGESAFDVDDGDGDETLCSVYLPETVKDVGPYAFYGCSGLKSVNLENIENLYEGAFFECTGLEKAELGVLEMFGQYAFYGCASLKYVKLEGVEVFEEQAMRNCPALEQVEFGDGVEALAKYTFYESDGVRYLSFGKAFSQEVTSDTFPTGLERVEVSEHNAIYTTEGGILYNKDKTEIVCVPYSIKGRVKIADSVKAIKADAAHFKGHRYITSLTIPASVTSIDGGLMKESFTNCHHIAEVYNLTSIDLTEEEWTGGNIYDLPEGVVFHTSLAEASVVSDPDGDGFVWQTETGALLAYFGSETELMLPNGYDGKPYSVGYYAFQKTESLEKVTVPAQVLALGESCFGGCENLKEVALEEGLEEIGTGVFKDCTALTKITIPKSMKKVGAGAFASCNALERVDYGGSVSEWAAIDFRNRFANIFEGKQAALYLGDGKPLPEKIVIEGIEKIGDNAFYGAPLKEVVIGEGVKQIGQDSFSYCAELKTVVLGKEIEDFYHSFANGSPIEKVYYEGTKESWQGLHGGDGGSSALPQSTKVFFFAEQNPQSGDAWHYGSNGEIEEW